MRKGRFKKPAAGIAQRYGESVSFDWRLYRYEVVGKIVAHYAAHEIPLNRVPLTELKKSSSLIDSDVAKIFDVRGALAKKRAIGAPSAENIAAQIKRWRSDLGT